MDTKHTWATRQMTYDLLNQAHKLAAEYLSRVETASVYPDEGSIDCLSTFDEPLPDHSTNPEDVLRQLHNNGGPATVAQSSGRYFGFVNGGVLPIGLASRWLADTWDQNTAHYVMSPLNAHLEDVCERWLVDLFGFPSGTAAGFVTGTTLANFSGLCAGRNESLRRLGWDVMRQGLYGAPPLRVIVGAGAHAALAKSVSMLGLGTDHIEVVPEDEHGRICPAQMPQLSQPALIVLQAGNVNSGAFDPIGEICDQVADSNSWVHVDGAFGLWARALPRLQQQCCGWGKADSWAVDAHKTLNVPYDSGIVLCKNRDALTQAFQASASYFQWSEQRDPMRYTPSMSKRARSIELWAVLKTLGRQGIIELIEQLCNNATMFAGKLKAHGFSILNEIAFNQVLVACATDALTEKTLDHIQTSGECWCGGSKWNGKSVIRISVCDWATSEVEIDRSVAAFVAARELAESESADAK